MSNFSKLWEQLSSPLMDSGEDDRVLSLVQSGLDLHPERKKTFWQEFSILCNNVDAMAELLGVSREKVRNFSARIHTYLEKLEKRKHESPKFKEKKQLMPTGDNGAFIATNTDPNLR